MDDVDEPNPTDLQSTFAAWINPLSTIDPPVVLVGAGLSYGLVPTANEYGYEIGQRSKAIEETLGVVATIIPTDAQSLYQWADQCISALMATGLNESEAKLSLAHGMGLTTDARFLSKANVPSRGTTPRHRVLCRLAREGRIESFWSFNWDCWLESSLEAVGLRRDLKANKTMMAPHGWKLRYVVWFSGSSSTSTTDTMLVFKAHGCVQALYESKGDFVVTESEMAKTLSEQPAERIARLTGEVSDRWLVTIGWSATEGYVKELFVKQSNAGLLGGGLTIIDKDCQQPGHLEVYSSCGTDVVAAGVSVSGSDLGTTDDLLLWIQTLRGFGSMIAACEGYPALQQVLEARSAQTPAFNAAGFQRCGSVSFMDSWLPAWLRICFISKAQTHKFTAGNELLVLPDEERDAHIPWAPLSDPRHDLMAAVPLLEVLVGNAARWDLEMFPGGLWDGPNLNLVVPVPIWADEESISHFSLKPHFEHWKHRARIVSVKLLPLDAPDNVTMDPEVRSARLLRWKESLTKCFGGIHLAVVDNYEDVGLSWLVAA